MNKIMARIDNVRKEKGYTQAEITTPLGINSNNYTSWLQGRTTTYHKYLPKIAEILGVTVDYLANGVKTENDEFLSLYAKAPEDIQQAVLTILRRCQVK